MAPWGDDLVYAAVVWRQSYASHYEVIFLADGKTSIVHQQRIERMNLKFMPPKIVDVDERAKELEKEEQVALDPQKKVVYDVIHQDNPDPRDIIAFYGYCKKKKKFCVSLRGNLGEGDEYKSKEIGFEWLRSSDLEDTHDDWRDLCTKKGIPQKNHNGVSYLPFTALYGNSPGLVCVKTAYLALVRNDLSPNQLSQIEGLPLSLAAFSEATCTHNFPWRLTTPRRFTGVPRQPGKYMICLDLNHTSALEMNENGKLTHWPDGVITQQDITPRLKKPYQAIKLILADTKKRTKKRRRSRKKRK